MYHIGNDKRAKESSQKIAAALEHLLSKHAFEQISVSQICAQAEVSRTTFYRLFDIPADIILWSCETSTHQLCEDLSQAAPEVLEMPFRFNVRHIFEHPQALELACKAGRIDIADAAFARNISPLLSTMRQKYGISDADLHMSTVLVSAIITSSFKLWLEDGKREPIDQVYERVVRIIQHLH